MDDFDIQEELQLVLVEPDKNVQKNKLDAVEEKINRMCDKCDDIIKKLRSRRKVG